ERTDKIDHFQPAKKFRTLLFPDNRPAWPLDPRNRCIRVDSDDKDVAKCAGAVQYIDMAGMQNVKAAIRENNFLPGSLQPQDFFAQRWLRSHPWVLPMYASRVSRLRAQIRARRSSFPDRLGTIYRVGTATRFRRSAYRPTYAVPSLCSHASTAWTHSRRSRTG